MDSQLPILLVGGTGNLGGRVVKALVARGRRVRAMDGVDAVATTAIGYSRGDKAPDVPHFHQKKLIEDYARVKDVPFVALRPGAFVGGFDFWSRGSAKRHAAK